MYLLGQLEHGTYREDEDWSEEDPLDLASGYGVTDEVPRNARQLQQVRCNIEQDAASMHLLENNLQDLRLLGVGVGNLDTITSCVRRQLKHKAVSIPCIADQFADLPDHKQLFWEILTQAAADNVFPGGYGFYPGEEGFGEWSHAETVVVGKCRHGKQYKVQLPREVWEPRAKAWVQALEGVMHMTA
jgi:hypothetical protein